MFIQRSDSVPDEISSFFVFSLKPPKTDITFFCAKLKLSQPDPC